jgi:hypothetical protein
LKKLGMLGLALAALLALATVAFAQQAPLSVQIDGAIKPTKGGKKKKPKNARLQLKFSVNPDSRRTVSTITFYVPRNVKLSGKGFRFCPASQINSQGEGSCPKGSKVGSGTATALLGPTLLPQNFTVGVYAGSKNELALALTGTISIAFRGLINKAGLPFGQKLTVDIPPQVQQPAPGLFSYITGVDTTIKAKGKAKKKKGKKRKKRYFASLTGCPKDRTHDVGVQLTYVQNDAGAAGVSDQFRSTVACRR